MRLIKLTEYSGDPRVESMPVWLNPACIQYIRPHSDPSVTEVRCSGTSVFVLGTAETVLGLVGAEQ